MKSMDYMGLYNALNGMIDSILSEVAGHALDIQSLGSDLATAQVDISTNTGNIASNTSVIAKVKECLLSNEFLYANEFAPWHGIGLLSGTAAAVSGTHIHPGILALISAGTANSGYVVRSNVSAIGLAGNEKTTIIFKTPADMSNISRYLGFWDSVDGITFVDVLAANIVNGVISGIARSGGVETATATTFNLSASTWYRLVIFCDVDISPYGLFVLYGDNSSTVLWSDNVQSNIPVDTGRELGHGDICICTNTDTKDLGYLDYMNLQLGNARLI